MAFLTFGGTFLKFGADFLTFGNDAAPPVTPVRRGDDAFRSAGARERFWAEQAEELLQDRLEQLPEVAKKPKRARKRFAQAFLQRVEAFDLPVARVDTLTALLADLTAPQPDYTALAKAAAEWLDRMARDKRRWRDNRDMLALMELGAL